MPLTPFNPFPGLRPFDRSENDRFFGREEHVDELLRRLRGHRFVAVIGASGSGKSSLVRAGMLPALEGGFMVRAGSDWRMATLRPGGDPMGNLARRLTRPDIFGAEDADDLDRELETDMAAAVLRRSRQGLVQLVREARMAPTENLLVVVDQFEELFRFRSELRDAVSDEASAFVRLLLTAAEQEEVPIYVVITMRSDFLGDCAQFAGLPEAINESQYLVPRLLRRQLELAIRGPIGVGGGRIGGPLLQQLLNDVSDDPDQLPILQHALMRTVDHWLATRSGDEPVSLEHYRAIGGMAEALSRHADEAYAELGDELAAVAERIFKSLTEKGQGDRGIRRPTRLADLAEITGASTDEVRAVVDVFRAPGRTFLVPSADEQRELDDAQVIDISHESLMRVWTRLARWADEEAEAARFYRRLRETAWLYPAEAGLWRNPELEIAGRWRQESRPTAAWAERYGGDFERAIEFLEASQEAWDREQAAHEAQQKGDTSKKLAFAAERALAEDHELATLLAVAAGRAYATDEAERALRLVLDHRGRSTSLLLAGDGDPVIDLAPIAETGLISSSLDGTVIVWDRASSLARHRLEGHRSAVRVAVNPAGTLLATAGLDGAVGIWDPETGELRHRLTGHQAGVSAAAWNRDGRRLVTASYDLTARIWDAVRGEELAVLAGHSDWVLAPSWHGEEVATASSDATARVWDAAGAEVAVLAGHGDKVRDVRWSPTGDRLATASTDSTARIWARADGGLLHVLAGHADWVVALAWSHDGERLATASRDGTVAVWVAGDGRRLLRIAAHQGGVATVAWSAADHRLLTAGADGTARVWDSGSGHAVATLTGHQGPVHAACWIGGEERGQRIATGGDDGAVRCWDPAPGYARIPQRRDARLPRLWDARWSPDAERIATAHQDGTVRVSSSRDGSEPVVLVPPPRAPGAPVAPIDRVAWSPTGDRLLALGRGHRATVWTTGDVLHADDGADAAARTFDRHRSAVVDGDFHPGGTRIATGGSDGRVWLWSPDVPEHAPAVGDHGAPINALAWTADGSRLLAAGWDGTVSLWDVAAEPPALAPARTLRGHSTAVLHAAWSPGAARVASVGMDQTVRLWHAESGDELETLAGHHHWTTRVAWSPDGQQLASAGRDGTARLWRTRPGEGADEVTVLTGHGAPVRWIEFSPDGRRLLTAGDDGTVRLWHAALDDPLRGYEILVLARHPSPLACARWSAQGDHILTAAQDGTVRTYLSALPDLVDEAFHRAVRGPRPDEAERHGLPLTETGAGGRAGASQPATPQRGAPSTARRRPSRDPSRPWRIAGVIFAENEWAYEVHRGLLSGARAAQAELGAAVELTIEHHAFDLARETALIDRFLAAGTDALVVTPRDLQASVPKIREAWELGVEVVLVGTAINLQDAERYTASFYESDQFELGYRTGAYLSQWLVDRGLAGETLDLGIVQCERFEQCYQRGRGFRAALRESGIAWREVSNLEGLILEEATARTEEMLRAHPEILVVFTEHDESTRGAVEAVRRLGLAGKVFVFGTDIADAIAQMLRDDDGVLQAATGQQARRMGRRAVLDAVRRLQGETITPFHKVLASPLYTREPWDADKLRQWGDVAPTGDDEGGRADG